MFSANTKLVFIVVKYIHVAVPWHLPVLRRVFFFCLLVYYFLEHSMAVFKRHKGGTKA